MGFNESEWEEFGWEDLEEAKRWYEAGWGNPNVGDKEPEQLPDEIIDARLYKEAGWDDPEEAYRWYEVGWYLRAQDELTLYKAGWKAEDMPRWFDEYSTSEAVDFWLDKPEEALRWKEAGWESAENAYGWCRAGWEDPVEALEWRKAWTQWLGESEFLKQARMDADERKNTINRIIYDILPSMALSWKEAGWDDPHKIFGWIEEKHKYTSETLLLRKMAKDGLKPGEEDRWYIKGWDKHPGRISIWREAGWDDPEEALRWHNAGFSPEIALKWHRSGLWDSADEKEMKVACRILYVLGVNDPYEARKLLDDMLKKDNQRTKPGRQARTPGR